MFRYLLFAVMLLTMEDIKISKNSVPLSHMKQKRCVAYGTLIFLIFISFSVKDIKMKTYT